MAININSDTIALIERFFGLVIRQLPNLAVAARSIINLLKSDEISDEQLATAHANLEAADAELQAAIDKRKETI